MNCHTHTHTHRGDLCNKQNHWWIDCNDTRGRYTVCVLFCFFFFGLLYVHPAKGPPRNQLLNINFGWFMTLFFSFRSWPSWGYFYWTQSRTVTPQKLIIRRTQNTPIGAKTKKKKKHYIEQVLYRKLFWFMSRGESMHLIIFPKNKKISNHATSLLHLYISLPPNLSPLLRSLTIRARALVQDNNTQQKRGHRVPLPFLPVFFFFLSSLNIAPIALSPGTWPNTRVRKRKVVEVRRGWSITPPPPPPSPFRFSDFPGVGVEGNQLIRCIVFLGVISLMQTLPDFCT